MSDKKCERLQSNLLQQNVYVRDCARAVDVVSTLCRDYPELERKDTNCGFEEKIVIRDYPITPETVNSYVETADYKNNLVEAMNASSRGAGLGDVRDIQNLQELDSVEIQRRIAELQKVLSEQPVASGPASEVSVENNNKDGDK